MSGTVDYQGRRNLARKVLQSNGCDAFLVTVENNVTWLTGFSGDSTYLLLTAQGEMLISDFRYVTQLKEECPGVPAHIRNSSTRLPQAVVEQLVAGNLQRVALEAHSVDLELFEQLRQASNVEWVSTSWEIEQFRAVKDEFEIAELKQAIAFAELGFDWLRENLDPQTTERQLAAGLENVLREHGAEGFSFPAIIAVGDRSALPHYRPSEIALKTAPILLVDWGAKTWSGYRSDLTRTILTRPFEPKFEKVYRTVLEAQERAITAIRPGVTCAEVDAAARDFIQQEGFGQYFDHGLGHGIGLDIHELPRFAQGSQTILKPGMVVTVEPGIYLAGWGGVRIEDDVLVTASGAEVLSSVPKDWDAAQLS